MSGYRELNRIVLDEKLIHRYLLERLYLAPLDIQRQLLPERLRGYPINLIVPEQGSGLDGTCRLDLDIHLTGLAEPVPNEAKWHAGDLRKKPAQVKELQRRHGFCSALFLPPPDQRIPGIDYVQIPYPDFEKWFLERGRVLLEETARGHRQGQLFEQAKSYWLVPVRSKEAVANFNKMMAFSRKTKNAFWAFRNKRQPMEGVLAMKESDRCLFLRMTGKSGQVRLKEGTKSYRIRAWHEGHVTRPYHIRLKGDVAHVFEDTQSVAERRWPQFISVRFEDMEEPCDFVLPLRKDLGKRFTDAINQHHAPLEVTQEEYGIILQQLRHRISLW